MARRRKYLDSREKQTAVSVDPYIFHCCKRCASKRQTRYLPQEMLFNILLHHPPQVIHDVMRHVCREWNLMIRSREFIHHHLRNSTCGILFQQLHPRHNVIYVEMRRGCLEISKFDWGLEDIVCTSCNGLVLVPHLRDMYVLCISNPLTKQLVFLPPCFHEIEYCEGFSLAFVEASMEYKVVNTTGPTPLTPVKQIAVLTVGVDRVWRHIDVEHFPLTTRRAFVPRPFVTGGYIHWIGGTFVLTLNAETETFCEFPMPQMERRFRTFLPMGSNLSVVYDSSEFSRDVWEMDSETGEWTMLLCFDLKPQHDRLKGFFEKKLKTMFPLGWLAVREVLVFSTTTFFQRRCVAYNVKTGEIQLFELDTYCSNTNANSYNYQAHVNSLVCLEGGF